MKKKSNSGVIIGLLCVIIIGLIAVIIFLLTDNKDDNKVIENNNEQNNVVENQNNNTDSEEKRELKKYGRKIYYQTPSDDYLYYYSDLLENEYTNIFEYIINQEKLNVEVEKVDNEPIILTSDQVNELFNTLKQYKVETFEKYGVGPYNRLIIKYTRNSKDYQITIAESGMILFDDDNITYILENELSANFDNKKYENPTAQVPEAGFRVSNIGTALSKYFN